MANAVDLSGNTIVAGVRTPSYKDKTLAIPKAGPAIRVVSVTPSDTVDIPEGPCRALIADSAGVVTIIDLNGDQVTTYLAAGVNSVGARRVFSTGLGPSLVDALY